MAKSDWGIWSARIGGYALAPWTGGASIPIGEAVAQGISSANANQQAGQQQQAGTQQANARLTGAGQVNQQVYDQQRRDYQGLANAPYQSLASMVGVDIPSITPVAFSGGEGGTLASLTNRNGAPAGYDPQPRLRPDGVEAIGQAVARGPQAAQQQSASGYGGGGAVQMRAPDGQVYMVPQEHAKAARLAGGQVVG